MATSFVLVYKGGGMPETEEEGQAQLAAWGAWYEALGPAVVDGGNPFSQSLGLAADGSVSQGAPSGLTGYTILSADSIDQAGDLAKGCPILASGGTVEVYETIQVM